jgi:Amt family ammonium transporter
MGGINAGDTAWLLVSAALVLMMTPALAFYYGGMVRRKNILSTLTLSFALMGLISVQWVLYGYSLAFGEDLGGGLLGGLNLAGLMGVGAAPSRYAPTVPHLAFAAFQMMFAIITPALITGAFVERVRFGAFLIFSLLWATLVYDPVCHWVWGEGGLLRSMGALEFAGGTVVHITAGFSALAFALVIGPRRGFGRTPFEPANIPYSVLGAGLLWIGWFGLTGGSARAADGVAALAVMNTGASAAAAGLVWMALSWRAHKPSVLGIVTGAVVGLVAITPGAGYVTPLAAIVIGGLASAFSYYAIRLIKGRNLVDESLDVFACHGLGGLWGALATGLFATRTVNPNGADGLFYGNPAQFGAQTLAALAVIVLAMGMTWAIASLLKAIIGLRVTANEEQVGLDISEHGERAYS